MQGQPEDRYAGHLGMSLRDWFAGQILPETSRRACEIIDHSGEQSFDALIIARATYAIADAMLIERTKAGTKPAN